jgi:hypothetical protein
MVETKLTTVPIHSDGLIGDVGVEISVQCLSCKHFGKQPITCAAFPEGIPEEIVSGEFDHNNAFEGDGGIRYEKK